MARKPETISHDDPVTAVAATITKIAATLVSKTMTTQRPSATAKPM